MPCPLSLVADAPAAAAFGMAGLAGQLAWPLMRRRATILTLQCVITSCYAIQYALLGQSCGVVVCSIGATQTLIALAAGDRPWLRFLGLVFIPLAITATLLTWSGPASALALTACCLVMIGRMQRDMLRMRAVMLCASPFGIAYDIAVSAPALAGALLSAAIGTAAFAREWRARHPDTVFRLPGTPAPALA